VAKLGKREGRQISRWLSRAFESENKAGIQNYWGEVSTHILGEEGAVDAALGGVPFPGVRPVPSVLPMLAASKARPRELEGTWR
jgi:hypothetical protein